MSPNGGWWWPLADRHCSRPTPFWYFSLAGGTVLLAYARHRADPVFILGQAAGLVIYLRKLYLIRS